MRHNNWKSFQFFKKFFYHKRSAFILIVIWIIIAGLEKASKNRLRNVFSKITILTANIKKFIAISSSRYETVILFRKFFIRFLIRANLFEGSLACMRILSNSIFRKTAIVPRMFFVWLILRLKSSHNWSNYLQYNSISTPDTRITKKSFR